MFENDHDIGLDVDDGFLNVVFETEERYSNNNKPPNNCKSSYDGSIKLNTASPVQNSLQDQQDTSIHEHFRTSHNLSLSEPTSEPNFSDFSSAPWIHHKENDGSGDKENKRKASPPHSRAKRERKFPGPAGLLPDRKSLSTPLKPDKLPEVESPPVSNSEELCSQGRLSGSVLEEGPWQSLITDLGPHADVLDIVNVASVKRKAAARCFVGRKVPLLAAVLHHLDVSSADPCVILRDTTGEIHGTLHREVWQQFAAELVVGSVLVIRNVGLLSTGLSSRRHYLNITANNLATIYSANPDKSQRRELHTLSSHDYLRTVEHWKSLVAPPRNTGSPSSSLFNTSLPSPCSSSPAQSVPPHLSGARHPGIPQISNTRPTTFQHFQEHGRLPVTPPYQKTNPQSRTMGKNLFSSSLNSHNPNKVKALFNNNSPCLGRPNQSNPSLTKNTFNNPRLSHSGPKPNTSAKPNTSSSASFKFDPVMLKNKTFDGAPQPSSLKPCNSTIDFRTNCENRSAINSPRIILSQTSQLTQEEQSVVESVFEGIDADSLFDDDF